MYALVDCNNFYASCEQLFDLSLRGRPVVVLSNNDGCVIARSAEAKAMGIPMGVPAFKFKRAFAEQGVLVRSSNYALYGDMSRRVMGTLAEAAPDMEVYSIDEAFLSLAGFPLESLHAYGQELCQRVAKCVGLKVGVGTGPTKTLAKAANWWAKKSGDGVCTLVDYEQIRALLATMPIDEVWGIGRRHSKRLKARGLQSALDFVERLSAEQVENMMSITGLRTWKELQGIPCITLELQPPPKQSIATTRTFGKMVRTEKGLQEAVSSFASSCAAKLRKERLMARRLMLFIHTNGFRKELPQYSRNIVVTLPVATADTLELVHYAKAALSKIYRDEYEYKKAGVVVSEIVPQEEVQTSFLDAVDRDKQQHLMQALDAVTGRFGDKALHLAATGSKSRRESWHMNQNQLSPRYTTRWGDILRVK